MPATDEGLGGTAVRVWQPDVVLPCFVGVPALHCHVCCLHTDIGACLKSPSPDSSAVPVYSVCMPEPSSVLILTASIPRFPHGRRRSAARLAGGPPWTRQPRSTRRRSCRRRHCTKRQTRLRCPLPSLLSLVYCDRCAVSFVAGQLTGIGVSPYRSRGLRRCKNGSRILRLESLAGG